jgi:hypothetical protein
MEEKLADRLLASLTTGRLYDFSAWPNLDVPRVASGVYTIWNRDGGYLYAGMAGGSLTQESISERRLNPMAQAELWGRLNSHASGRRSGDQFCLYVADRLVLPTLARETIAAVGNGTESMDRLAKEFIRKELSYRFVETRDSAETLEVERLARGGLASLGKPLLNPLGR